MFLVCDKDIDGGVWVDGMEIGGGLIVFFFCFWFCDCIDIEREGGIGVFLFFW